MTDARLYDAAITLLYVGRSSGLAVNPMIVYTPLVIPAPPTLVRVRPKISSVENGRTPQIRLPSSKMKTDSRKLYLMSQNSEALPQVDWKAEMVRKKADPIQDTKS
jgi:hypothetical protein